MDKIEIKLTHVNDEHVNLDNMSKDALVSFLSVVNCLKNISDNLLSNEATFSIKKGSALFSVNSTPTDIGHFYDMMNEAISGNSTDTIVTENMRKIQKELQNPLFTYKLFYKDIDIAPRIKNAKKITKKRVYKLLNYKFEILTGFFNQIGGNEPNYHFDQGGGNRITIECTIEDAAELKYSLYNNISTIVISKVNNNVEDKITYDHRAILKQDQITHLKKFIDIYNSKNDIIDRLDCIYDFIDNSNNIEEDILLLLKIFNSKVFDINEIKTILVISKNIKDANNQIKLHRDKLLSLFNYLLN